MTVGWTEGGGATRDERQEDVAGSSRPRRRQQTPEALQETAFRLVFKEHQSISLQNGGGVAQEKSRQVVGDGVLV